MSTGLSDKERQHLKERTTELRNDKRSGTGSKKAEKDRAAVVEKIAAMPDPDRVIAERVHELIAAEAPELAPKLWYGQPAYARDGKVVCFFRSGQDDGERYSTFGFTPEASLDEETGLWASSFAVTELTEAGEEQILELLTRATA